jgi:uncharacterized membrane protein
METAYKNAFLLLGVFLTACRLKEVPKQANLSDEQYFHLVLAASCTYGVIGYFTQSSLLWLFALVSLGSWLCMESHYYEKSCGISTPVSFVFLGVILSLLAFTLKNCKGFKVLQKTTLGVGLFYLFVALWFLSIFSTHEHHEFFSLFFWNIAFGGAAMLNIYWGLRMNIPMMQRYGITFFTINLFTEYCECFWDVHHKSIFFLILGIILWIIAHKLEKKWLQPTELWRHPKEDT